MRLPSVEQQGRFNVRGFCVWGRVRDLFSMFSSLGRSFLIQFPLSLLITKLIFTRRKLTVEQWENGIK